MKIKHINVKKIEAAIEDFEKQVDFEFIPVIAMRSSYVEHITWVASLLAMLLLIGLIDTVFKMFFSDSWISSTPFYLASPFIAYAIGLILDKSDIVDRFFITKKERQRQVHQMAELAFYRHRLHEIESNNALMLFISVMERQIVLLPDPRLQFDKIKEIDEQLLKILQESFKQSDFERGILKAIEHLKLSLMPQFSKKTASANKVPNKLIWWHV